MKYTEGSDLFNPDVLNLFDYETGLTIGYITPVENKFIAVVVGKRGTATFNNIHCAKGFITSTIYGKKPRSKSKDKQLILKL
jgi:hypothetical protein